ncbi:MAG: tRNA 2-thiouridine(34) synthase MnmA [Clostridiales bacterium]|nr:tRNA 2-thiouridine(34) synthase MnmA [Clostridiales bacterium]
MNTTELDNKKVVLGMSGGVDSTAAALILMEQGYDVTGLYFDVFGKGENSAEKAKEAADKLGIPLVYRDISKQFKSKVITYFYNEYASGRTPNPCTMCNKTVKFNVLLEEADKLGCRYIATGHYADTLKMPDSDDVVIKLCSNIKKDQSYMLWRLGQDELRRVIFPLKDFTSKEDIRDILRNKGFANAETKDSQEICFIENDDYISFLTEDMGMKPKAGKFVDKFGNTLGMHQGIIRYTVGQRKGLGVTFGKPVFVTEIDAENNEIVLGDNEDLFKKEIISSNNSFCTSHKYFGMPLTGKIRYAAKYSPCVLEHMEDGRIKTVFEEPQRAPTPGQSIVWYFEDIMIGGGIIDKI